MSVNWKKIVNVTIILRHVYYYEDGNCLKTVEFHDLIYEYYYPLSYSVLLSVSEWECHGRVV